MKNDRENGAENEADEIPERQRRIVNEMEVFLR
jgi:hypothetical protein